MGGDRQSDVETAITIWTSLRLCSVRDHDPGGPVVARSFPAADFAIDACADQTGGRRRAQKQMIDA
jgi:hypothetical protein